MLFEMPTNTVAPRLPRSPPLFTSQTPTKALEKFYHHVLLRDDSGSVVHYGDVLELSARREFQATSNCLVMCGTSNDVVGIKGYLAFLTIRAVPIMVSPTSLRHSIASLTSAYSPDFFWLPRQFVKTDAEAEVIYEGDGYALIRRRKSSNSSDLHEDLAVLLSTSGSTGSRKYVRLSHQNIWSNAAAIADYLSLTADERPITTLPPTYSYGLSIIHSHLWVGAEIAVTNKTFFDRDFWAFLREVEASSLAGVPYHYEILSKLGFKRMELPHLRTLTQAGGRMSLELTREYASHCHSKGMRYFTMYGQTEASPRMAYVPADQSSTKAGTIGIAIPGGAFDLILEDGTLLTDPNVVGELVYRGPNVCMGYAESRKDLAAGDINCGVLYTGDLAERDKDGYYTIVGRKNRFIKLFGNRVNLEDIELQLSGSNLELACSGEDDLLEIYLVTSSETIGLEIKQAAITKLQVAAQGVTVYGLDTLPRNESGKIRYADLKPSKDRKLA